MPVTTSQILKFVDFTKTQTPGYLENETFFTQIKKLINYISRATLLQEIVLWPRQPLRRNANFLTSAIDCDYK